MIITVVFLYFKYNKIMQNKLIVGIVVKLVLSFIKYIFNENLVLE